MAEKEGVKRSIRAMEDADLVIAVIDGSEPMKNEDIEIIEKAKDKNTIIVINKSDLQARENTALRLALYTSRILEVSAKYGEGLEELKEIIFQSSVKNWKEQKEGVVITNLRHKVAIQAAYDSLKDALKAIETGKPLEIIAIEFRDSLDRLGEIVGAVTTDDILNRIFSDFCIGK
jgi:tRNA modification GTPase